jgi:16S rRNA G966 N2-methylase RsmD
MNAPFPYFGGKRTIAAAVWARLGSPKQYIEPFCGSAAMLLAAPSRASLEVVNDTNGFIANFWRAVKHQPEKVAEWCDYPMSHIDLGARHAWLREHTGDLDALRDADWPGDAKIAGWWLWGQCAWIGAGWCDGRKNTPDVLANLPHASSAGRGIQAVGKIPHASNAGRGDDAPVMPGELLTSCGRTAWRWLRELANRLERTRITHGDWSRCLNSHYGGADTAVFLDPPYRSFGVVYGAAGTLVADECETWARENAGLRVALCGHRGDYQLDGWDVLEWSREKATYSGSKTTDEECIWFSPACLRPEADRQIPLF